MNKKIIKSSMILILILMVIGSIYCLAKYTVSNKTTMSASSLQMSANNGSAGTLVAGEKIQIHIHIIQELVNLKEMETVQQHIKIPYIRTFKYIV